MKRNGSLLLMLVVFLLTAGIATNGFSQSNGNLNMVFIQADSPGQVKKIAALGMDIARVKKTSVVAGAEGFETQAFTVEAVVSPKDELKLTAAGFKFSYATVAKTRSMRAAVESVYHSFDEPVLGIKDQLKAIEKKYPKIAKLHTIGYSIQGRPLLAIYLTKKSGHN